MTEETPGADAPPTPPVANPVSPLPEEGAPASGPDNTPAGKRPPRSPLLVAAGALVFALLATGSLLGGIAVASGGSEEPAAEIEPTIDPRTPPPTVPPAVALRTCSVDPLAAVVELDLLHAAVLRLDESGSELLYGANETSPIPVGGVMKLYTAAAALAVLGADFRISTSVVEGSTPGSAVLIGRGDPTLSRLPEGEDGFYPGSPRLASLAAQLVDIWADTHPGEQLTQLIVDTSYWNVGDDWNPAWPSDARSAGTMPFIVSLMVDGDRDDPKKQTSKRSDDPVKRATESFLAALLAADPDGLVVDPGIAVTTGTATSGAALLAEVQSQPVKSLVQHMLRTDDNTLAEMLARVTSQRGGLDGSMSSVSGVIPSALTETDIPVDGLVVDDGSGLSPDSRVPMADLAVFLGLIQDGGNGLADIYDALSVAGESGGLAERFSDSPAKGEVTAKTGRNSLAAAMAGIVEARDGALLAFAVSASREGVGTGAWGPMDALVAGFYACGSNLAAG